MGPIAKGPAAEFATEVTEHTERPKERSDGSGFPSLCPLCSLWPNGLWEKK